MVQQRREPCVLVLSCYLTHTVQLTWRALPGSESGTRFAGRVPLGQPRRTSSFLVNLLTVPRPLRRGVPRHPLQDQECLPWPSPCECRLGSPLTPPEGRDTRNDAAGFTSCCGPASRSPPHRDFVAPLRRTGSLPPPGAVLPGTLTSPRTGLTPAGQRELVARLHHRYLLDLRRPSCWTHNYTGVTLIERY